VQVLGLSRTSFAAKRETKLLEGSRQANGATCSERDDSWEALGERLVRTRSIQAAETPDSQA
jgi:hypothetical protein